MKTTRNPQPGTLVEAPCVLVHPHRSGRWTRHLYTLGVVLRVGKGQKTGAPVALVRYADLNYTQTLEQWFRVDALADASGATDVALEKWERLNAGTVA